MYHSDINQFNDQPGDPGIQQDLEPWDEERVAERARTEGIDLTDEHREVLTFLRNHYVEEGPQESARAVLHALEERFESRGGRRHLYELFPRGPIAQGTRIAGVPSPTYLHDRGFGSTT